MNEHDTDSQLADDLPSQDPPLGPLLRAAREARSESLAEAAGALKLSARQLAAIEEERFDDLPGPAFVRGFVRNYGRHLGVDVEPLIAARWGVGAASPAELKPLTNAEGILPVSGERSRVRRLALPLALVAAVGLALAWYFDGFDPLPASELAGQAPEVRAEAQGLPPSRDGGEMPPSEQTAEPVEPVEPVELMEGPVVAPPEPSGLQESGPAEESPVVLPEALPADEASSLPEESASTGEMQAVVPQPEPAAPEEEASPEAQADTGRLVFRLAEESWIDVRDGRERRLYAGISAAGSERVVQGQPPFTIVIGNARAARLEHAGREIDLAPHVSAGGVARLKVE